MRFVVAALLALVSLPVSADEVCGRQGSSEFLQLVAWTIEPVDERTNRMTETLVLHGDKPIRMIDGSIIYRDVLGGSIASKAIDRDIRLAPGSEYVQEGNWGQFTFERILEMERQDVVAFVCTKAVVYDDGTSQQFE
jgi:hypothetical protein